MKNNNSLFEDRLEKKIPKKLNKVIVFGAFCGMTFLVILGVLILPNFKFSEEKSVKPGDKIIGKPELNNSSDKDTVEKKPESDIDFSGNMGLNNLSKTTGYSLGGREEEADDRESVKTELKRAILDKIDGFQKVESAISNSDFENAKKTADLAFCCDSLPMYFIQGQGADPEFAKIVNLTNECASQYVTATDSFIASTKSYISQELSVQYRQRGTSELSEAKKMKENLFLQLTTF